MPEEDFETKQLAIGRRLVYFAAERTLMAWVRAALGLMALGFVVDRFTLVLRQIAPTASIHYSKAFAFWGGTFLVLMGSILALVAALRYSLFAYHFRHEHSTWPGHGIVLGVIFTVIVAILGFIVAAFLLTAGD
jgi:putative membrane protein